MLKDQDRIFTNIYGWADPGLKAAKARGDWDGTAKLLKLGHDEIVELLIASGADINAKDGKERTPLHFAAEEGESDVAAELMRLGADVNARDIIGRTPLDFANKLPYLLRKRGAYTAEELKAEGK